MLRTRISILTPLLFAFALSTASARAEIGPCVPAVFDLICGNGNGAARVIVKTISPSKRLAFAWRLAKRPPGAIPNDDTDDLENFVIRIEDGAILAKSHGSYWDLSTKIAKAFLAVAWSPDSRLLVKVEQSAKYSSAELYSFTDADKATGPVDLVKVIKPAVLEKMHKTKDPDNSILLFAFKPAVTVDDQGLIHATVFTGARDAADGPTYDVVVQAVPAADSLAAEVVSITQYEGTSISIIVH